MTSNIYFVILYIVNFLSYIKTDVILDSTAHSAFKYINIYRYTTTTTEVIGI